VVISTQDEPFPAQTVEVAGTDAAPGCELDREIGVSVDTLPLSAMVLHRRTVPAVTLEEFKARYTSVVLEPDTRELMVTVALALLLGSAWLVALTVAVVVPLTVGAV
jgi:hypothetical protein